MALDKKQIDKINYKKALNFFTPLLTNIQNDEPIAFAQFHENTANTKFDFKRDFMIISDIQAYRHISCIGLLKDFDRSISYSILNLSVILDIWYNESKLIPKDQLRTCDVLIIYGTNDTKNGFRKAEALIDLINTRRAYGKYTWIFIHNTDLATFNLNQEGVSDEIKNVYSLKLKGKSNLNVILSHIMKSKPNQKHIDNTELETQDDNLHII